MMNIKKEMIGALFYIEYGGVFVVFEFVFIFNLFLHYDVHLQSIFALRNSRHPPFFHPKIKANVSKLYVYKFKFLYSIRM